MGGAVGVGSTPLIAYFPRRVVRGLGWVYECEGSIGIGRWVGEVRGRGRGKGGAPGGVQGEGDISFPSAPCKAKASLGHPGPHIPWSTWGY